MINSVKPLGQLVNKKREKEKQSKPMKKSQSFAKFLEQVVDDSDKEKGKK